MIKYKNLAGKYIVIYLLIALVLIGGSAFYYHQEKTIQAKIFAKVQVEELQNLKNALNAKAESLIDDLRYIASDQGLPLARHFTAQNLLNFSKHRRVYDQIRYLDETGQEIVRINFNNGNPTIVPPEKLQFKGDCYYFKDAFALKKGEIFVSPFDLNIENGKLEQPIKPILRIGTPYFINGKKKGLVLINFFGDELLNILRKALEHKNIHVTLFNQDGYWLFTTHKNKYRMWGFMYDHYQKETLAIKKPKLWQKLNTSYNNQFLVVPKDEEEMLFTSTILNPFKKYSPTARPWRLLTHVHNDVLMKNTASLFGLLVLINAILLLIGFIISILAYRADATRECHQEKILRLNGVLKITNKILRHDLANMFTAIRGYLDLYQKNPDGNIIIKSGDVAEKGINLIGQMRRMEGAVNSTEGAKKYQLSEVIKLVEAKNPDLKYTVIGDAEVVADEALEVVFDTLSDNAVRHGCAKKMMIVVTKFEKNKFEITIADDGKGMPQDICDKVFDEGFTYGDTGNTGLGLYIVKQTINRYQWQIKVKPNQPHGVIFKIIANRLAVKEIC